MSTYLIRDGYSTQHKRTGYGDGWTNQEQFTSSLEQANQIFDAFVKADGQTELRGDFYYIATVEIFEADENGEFSGDAIREFRSPMPKEVA